jgi:hypothetical protein
VWSYVGTELGEDARILAEWIAERDLGAYRRQRRAAPIGRMNRLSSSDSRGEYGEHVRFRSA